MIELMLAQDKKAGGPVPGNPALIAGDDQLGWYGEVTTAQLISGTSLATVLNLTAGVAFNNTSPWLKFAYKGKVLFIAKQNLRHTASWDNLSSVNAVTGNRIVTIGGVNYKVRLMQGSDGAGEQAPGREWDALMYRVSATSPLAAGSKWATYTDAELNVTSGTGYIGWCQEERASAPAQKVTRGNGGITAIAAYSGDRTEAIFGWRPVLELVP